MNVYISCEVVISHHWEINFYLNQEKEKMTKNKNEGVIHRDINENEI